MAKKNPSPKSMLRSSILKTYKRRGRKTNNIWLVYSHKTKQDVAVTSHRELVHLVCFLETDPEVTHFDLDPDVVMSSDDYGDRGTILDAVATLRSGKKRWDEVKSGKESENLSQISQKVAQSKASSAHGADYARFYDKDLAPKALLATRWLTAMSWITTIKGMELEKQALQVLLSIRKLQRGTIASIQSDLEGFDSAILMGLILRLAIEGTISIDLSKLTFGRNTQWVYRNA